MSPVPAESGQEPIANVTTPEVLVILNDPRFEAPPGVDAQGWQSAVKSARDAVGKLNLDLRVGEEKSYMRVMCGSVDTMVRRSEDIDDGLLADATISRVREEIAARLLIRIRLSRDKHFQELIDLIKAKGGKLDITSGGDLDGIEDGMKIKSVLYATVKPFGEETPRKMLGWSLIAEFLSERAGVKVEFMNQRFTQKRRRIDGDAEDAEVRTTARKAPRAKTAAEILNLPTDISLDALDLSEAGLEKYLDLLRTDADNLLATLEKQIAEIAEKLGTHDVTRKKMEMAVARIQQELEPYYESIKPVEARYTTILRTLKIMNPDLNALPKERQSKKDQEMANLQLPYKNTLGRLQTAMNELAPVVARMDLLASERARMETLKGTIQRLYAGFRELKIVQNEEPADDAGTESDADATGSDQPGTGEGEGEGEPESEQQIAEKTTKDLARWFRRLYDSIKSWPAFEGYKTVKETGRVDDLIAQLERMLQKKDLILTVVTDPRASGMLDTFLLDLQGAYPPGVTPARGRKTKERGSIKMDRFNTLMGILSDYEGEI